MENHIIFIFAFLYGSIKSKTISASNIHYLHNFNFYTVCTVVCFWSIIIFFSFSNPLIFKEYFFSFLHFFAPHIIIFSDSFCLHIFNLIRTYDCVCICGFFDYSLGGSLQKWDRGKALGNQVQNRFNRDEKNKVKLFVHIPMLQKKFNRECNMKKQRSMFKKKLNLF